MESSLIQLGLPLAKRWIGNLQDTEQGDIVVFQFVLCYELLWSTAVFQVNGKPCGTVSLYLKNIKHPAYFWDKNLKS